MAFASVSYPVYLFTNFKSNSDLEASDSQRTLEILFQTSKRNCKDPRGWDTDFRSLQQTQFPKGTPRRKHGAWPRTRISQKPLNLGPSKPWNSPPPPSTPALKQDQQRPTTGFHEVSILATTKLSAKSTLPPFSYD